MYRALPECHFVSHLHQWHMCVSFSIKHIRFGQSFSSQQRAQRYHAITSHAVTRLLKPRQILTHLSNQPLSPHKPHDLILKSSNSKECGRNFITYGRNQTACDGSPSIQPEVAILGGGISGLVTAHYIIRKIPNVKITLYESSNRLGGWLQSEYVDVENGKILIESGPRTLRSGTTSSLTVAELIQDLGLEEQVITTAKSSFAAKNRYIYCPDHLVRMPMPGDKLWGNILQVINEPLFKGIFPALMEFTRPTRPSGLEDESIASFFSRRLGGEDLVNNIHSAIFHGIYAGDVAELSIRSLFPTFWYMEKHFGSILKGLYFCARNKIQVIFPSELAIRKEICPKIKAALLGKLGGASVFSFDKGLETLSKALETRLRQAPNIEFKLGEEVKFIEPSRHRIKIKTSKSGNTATYSRVISTLLPHQTSALTPHLPSLAQIPAVTVMVVNLYYSSSTILPARGFGYLIPKNIPYDNNPELGLGVVFDSDAIQGQDTAPGTKLTVMMGGHWWNSFAAYPEDEEGIRMAKALLKRHLGINTEPDYVRVKLQKECIPQYNVGHHKILAQAKEEMRAFNGRLSVTGSGYRGVGVNDCVAAARNLVMLISSRTNSNMTTGLEWVEEDPKQIIFRDSLDS